jgi:hypothetical protein
VDAERRGIGVEPFAHQRHEGFGEARVARHAPPHAQRQRVMEARQLPRALHVGSRRGLRQWQLARRRERPAVAALPVLVPIERRAEANPLTENFKFAAQNALRAQQQLAFAPACGAAQRGFVEHLLGQERPQPRARSRHAKLRQRPRAAIGRGQAAPAQKLARGETRGGERPAAGLCQQVFNCRIHESRATSKARPRAGVTRSRRRRQLGPGPRAR